MLLEQRKTKKLTIALDLEGTLISNAVSQFPRPRLLTFLEYCHQNFDRLVIFTAVDEVRFRSISRTLAEAQDAPDWFVDLEYISSDINRSQSRCTPAHRVLESLIQYLPLLRLFPLKLARFAFQSCSVAPRFCH
jgi:hypothetical protein